MLELSLGLLELSLGLLELTLGLLELSLGCLELKSELLAMPLHGGHPLPEDREGIGQVGKLGATVYRE